MRAPPAVAGGERRGDGGVGRAAAPLLLLAAAAEKAALLLLPPARRRLRGPEDVPSELRRAEVLLLVVLLLRRPQGGPARRRRRRRRRSRSGGEERRQFRSGIIEPLGIQILPPRRARSAFVSASLSVSFARLHRCDDASRRLLVRLVVLASRRRRRRSKADDDNDAGSADASLLALAPLVAPALSRCSCSCSRSRSCSCCCSAAAEGALEPVEHEPASEEMERERQRERERVKERTKAFRPKSEQRAEEKNVFKLDSTSIARSLARGKRRSEPSPRFSAPSAVVSLHLLQTELADTMLSPLARRACKALACKALRDASKASSSAAASMATGRTFSSTSSTSSSSTSTSSSPSPGIEFSGGVRVPHTTTLAFVGGSGYGTSGALHPDLLAAVAREAAAAASQGGAGGGAGEATAAAAAAAAAQRFAARPLPTYWTIDFAGNDVVAPEKDEFCKENQDLSEEEAVKLYSSIARLQTMDAVFYESQRQGRFSFYMTSAGEEATAVGSAAALETSDPVFAQYREQGVLLHRGFAFRDFADQCFGNELEPGKGRQMPIHYGSQELAFHTISSPLATQLPQAVGTAYALSRDQSANKTKAEDRNVAVAYFGDGASSEGDFHAAANFAAVLAGKGEGDETAGGTPLVLICRNNGW